MMSLIQVNGKYWVLHMSDDEQFGVVIPNGDTTSEVAVHQLNHHEFQDLDRF